MDVTRAVEGLYDLQKRQLPFAVAKTLTGCAQAGQLATQESLAGKFTLRNDFTRRGIRIKPADKRGAVIEADVHTFTENRKTGAPDYLVRQEEGGEKLPYGGRKYLAVPTVYLRRMCPGPIPAELRPRNLLSAYGGSFTSIDFDKGRIIRHKQKRVQGFEFFVREIKDGHEAIMGRYATDRDAYPFYILIPDALIKARLGMEGTVNKAVQSAFPDIWQETWRSIMVRGLRVTL